MQLRDMPRLAVSYLLFLLAYSTNYCRKPPAHQQARYANHILDIEVAMSRSSMRQWRLTVAKMVKILKIIQAGFALTLPYVPLLTTFILIRTTQPYIISATIGLFLQPSVLDSTILRALAASSFLLSVASIGSASILVAAKDRMLSIHKRDQWIDASRHPMKWSSIGFWACLTWPFTSFVW